MQRYDNVQFCWRAECARWETAFSLSTTSSNSGSHGYITHTRRYLMLELNDASSDYFYSGDNIPTLFLFFLEAKDEMGHYSAVWIISVLLLCVCARLEQSKCNRLKKKKRRSVTTCRHALVKDSSSFSLQEQSNDWSHFPLNQFLLLSFLLAQAMQQLLLWTASFHIYLINLISVSCRRRRWRECLM